MEQYTQWLHGIGIGIRAMSEGLSELPGGTVTSCKGVIAARDGTFARCLESISPPWLSLCSTEQLHAYPKTPVLCERRAVPKVLTHFGSLPASHLEADLWENIDCSVCRTCRRTLLRLEELNVTTVHLETKTKVCMGSRKTATSLSITVRNRRVYSSERSPPSDRTAVAELLPT